MRDLHGFEKRLERYMGRISNDEIQLLPKNKQKILEFRDFCDTHCSPGRTLKYMYGMVKLNGLFGKPFEEVDKNDVNKVLNKIQNNGFSRWQKMDIKVLLKKYFKWSYGIPRKSKEYPSLVVDISSHMKKNEKKIPEEIQQRTGHRDINSLLWYVHLMTDKVTEKFLEVWKNESKWVKNVLG